MGQSLDACVGLHCMNMKGIFFCFDEIVFSTSNYK